MSYLLAAGSAEYYRNNVEAKRTVLDIVNRKKITGGPAQSGFFGGRNNRLGLGETFVRSCFYLDKDDRAIGSGHNKVYFAGLTGEVASKQFQAFTF